MIPRIATLLVLLGAMAASAQAQTAPLMDVRLEPIPPEAQTGDVIVFRSTLTNPSDAPSAPTLLFLTILDSQQAAPMDLEDWTTQRSVVVPPLAPHASASQEWSVRAIAHGDYKILVVAMPNATDSSRVSTSEAQAVHIAPRTNLNPGGIAGVALGVPLAVALIALAVRQGRRRRGAG
jgi:hypothetical protein